MNVSARATFFTTEFHLGLSAMFILVLWFTNENLLVKKCCHLQKESLLIMQKKLPIVPKLQIFCLMMMIIRL